MPFKPNEADYFNEAKSFADDVYGATLRSRNRYQVAFLTAMGLNVAALAAVLTLTKLHTFEPLLIHHYDQGLTTVERLKNFAVPINQAQVESDLIRYVTLRESYDSYSYKTQYELVTQLSEASVARAYAGEQDRRNQASPVNRLGTGFFREVHVYDIHFLDSLFSNKKESGHHNLAEIVFRLTDVDKASGQKTHQDYSALIAWNYHKPSDSPALRWNNWDGLEVVQYSRHERNLARDTV